MALPFIRRSASADLYSRGLGHALRSYRLYDSADFALHQDPDAYGKLRRDAVVSFALRYRKLLAAGSDWEVQPASARVEDKEVAAIFEGMLRQVNNFPTTLFNLSEAIIAGSRWAGISGSKKLLRLGNQPPMSWWVADSLKDIDKRRFRRMPDDEDSLNDDGLYANRRWKWQLFKPLQNGWIDIQRYHFIRHVFDDNEEALGFGSGLASEIYAYWYAKAKCLQEGLQFIERWAQGILKASVDSLRDGQASTLAATRAQNWLNELEKMRGRHVLVHDKNDELDVLEAPDSGWEAAKDALAYLDGAIRVLILGASLPTEAEVDGGSFAMAKVQASSTQAIVAHDRALLEETITRDLIRGCLWRVNLPILQFLGLGEASPPYFKIRDADKSNPTVNADVMLKAQQLGLRIKLNEAYAKLGLEVPGAADECVEPPTPSAPTPGFDAGPALNPNGLSPTDDSERPSDKPALEPERFDEDSSALAEKNERDGPNPKRPGMPFRALPSLDEIYERLERLERAEEEARSRNFNASLIAQAQQQQQPITVNVSPPAVTVEAPVVNVTTPPVNIPPAQVAIQPFSVNAPDVNVEVAAPNVTVEAAKAPDVSVNVEAPNVTVEAAQAPNVTVEAPQINFEAPRAEVPDIVVNVPSQAAPIVNVTSAAPSVTVAPAQPAINVIMPEPKAKKVEFEKDSRGLITGFEIKPEKS